MFKRILIPLDGSRTAEEALASAAALARMSGADLILLRALVVPSLGTGFVPANLGELRITEQTMAKEYLAEVKERLEDQGFDKVRTRVTEDEAAHAIIEVAQQEGVDLVVMCSHGRSGLNRWMFGSVAEKVLRYSSQQLFLVRPSPKQKD